MMKKVFVLAAAFAVFQAAAITATKEYVDRRDSANLAEIASATNAVAASYLRDLAAATNEVLTAALIESVSTNAVLIDALRADIEKGWVSDNWIIEFRLGNEWVQGDDSRIQEDITDASLSYSEMDGWRLTLVSRRGRTIVMRPREGDAGADAEYLSFALFDDADSPDIRAKRRRVGSPVPVNTSDLRNDSGFITQGEVQHPQLDPLYSHTPTFSEWVTDPPEYARLIYWTGTVWDMETYGQATGAGANDFEATVLTFPEFVGVGAIVATRRRLDLIGYMLGDQADKLLQPAGNNATAAALSAASNNVLRAAESASATYTDAATNAVSASYLRDLVAATNAIRKGFALSFTNDVCAIVTNTTEVWVFLDLPEGASNPRIVSWGGNDPAEVAFDLDGCTYQGVQCDRDDDGIIWFNCACDGAEISYHVKMYKVERNALGLARISDITNTVTKVYVESLGIESGIQDESDPVWLAEKGGYATTAALSAVSNEAQVIYRLFNSSNVVIEITNYNSVARSPQMRILQLNESNEYFTVWTETNGIAVASNSLARSCALAYTQALETVAANYAPRAWSRVTSGLGVDAPSNTTWISTPITVVAGGLEYSKIIHSGGAIWVLSGNGMTTFDPATNGYFRISADDGTEILSIEKTDSVTLGADAAGITVAGNTVTIPVPVVSRDPPVAYCRESLDDGDWVEVATGWSGTSGAWVFTYSGNPLPSSMFFKFTYESPGSTVIRNVAATDLAGGVLIDGVVHPASDLLADGASTSPGADNLSITVENGAYQLAEYAGAAVGTVPVKRASGLRWESLPSGGGGGGGGGGESDTVDLGPVYHTITNYTDAATNAVYRAATNAAYRAAVTYTDGATNAAYCAATNYTDGATNAVYRAATNAAYRAAVTYIDGATNAVLQSAKNWVEGKGYLTAHQSLDGYATEEWVEGKGYLTDDDLDGYATESWVEGKGYLTEHQSLDGYATEDWVEGQVAVDEVSIDRTRGRLSLKGFSTAPDNSVPMKDWMGNLVWGASSSSTNRIIAGSGIQIIENGGGAITISALPFDDSRAIVLDVITHIRYDEEQHKLQVKRRTVSLNGVVTPEQDWEDVFIAVSHSSDHGGE